MDTKDMIKDIKITLLSEVQMGRRHFDEIDLDDQNDLGIRYFKTLPSSIQASFVHEAMDKIQPSYLVTLLEENPSSLLNLIGKYVVECRHQEFCDMFDWEMSDYYEYERRRAAC